MNYGKIEMLIGALRRPDLVLRYLKGKQPSEYEINEVASLVQNQNALVVEAGAFDGRDTCTFSELWPTGRVYAFEPLPHLASEVRRRTSSLKNVTVMEMALGIDERTSLILHSADPETQIHGSSSLLQPEDHLEVAPEIVFNKDIEVQAITLDSWHQSIGSPDVDLLWLDLQGAELLVLAKGEHLLRQTSVCHIEVSRRPLYKGGATFKEVKNFFQQRGFKMVSSRIPVRSGNAIFAR